MSTQTFVTTGNSLSELSSRVAARREDLGMTQSELAAQIGVSREWVHRLENGNPGANIASVLKALDALGLVVATGQSSVATTQQPAQKKPRAVRVTTHRPAAEAPTALKRDSHPLAVSYVLPKSLSELKGPATGEVTLPNRLLWNASRPFNLSDDKRLRSLMRIVVREARAEEDLVKNVNRDQLVRLWGSLGLPTYIRDAWEDKFPELARERELATAN